MRTRIAVVFLPVLALVAALSTPMAAPASSAAISAAPANLAEGVPAFGHVFLIIGENTTYSHLTAVNAPYLLGTIQPHSAWLTSYYAATHWSQANYVALVTGQFTRCEQKDGGIACHQNTGNLFHQLDAAGLSWKVWLEAGTAKCDTGSGRQLHQQHALPADRVLHHRQPPDPVRRHRRAPAASGPRPPPRRNAWPTTSPPAPPTPGWPPSTPTWPPARWPASTW